MTEEESDLVFDKGEEFYRKYSELVQKTMQDIPEHLKPLMAAKIQEYSNIYSCGANNL